MTTAKSPSKRRDAEYSSARAVLRSHLGHDPVLQYMTREGHPLTAEIYIELNWGGVLPDEIDPEDEELLAALNILEK